MANFICEPPHEKSGNKLIDWFNDHAINNQSNTDHNPIAEFFRNILSSLK